MKSMFHVTRWSDLNGSPAELFVVDESWLSQAPCWKVKNGCGSRAKLSWFLKRLGSIDLDTIM